VSTASVDLAEKHVYSKRDMTRIARELGFVTLVSLSFGFVVDCGSAADAVVDAGAQNAGDGKTGAPQNAGVKCTTSPRTIVDSETFVAGDAGELVSPADIAVNGVDLYYTVSHSVPGDTSSGWTGTLMRVPIQGGTPTVVASVVGDHRGGGGRILLTANEVLFTQSLGGSAPDA